MGKLTKDMTKREIINQRERAKRNRKVYVYKSRTEKLIDKIYTEAEKQKVQIKQAGFYFGVIFAIEILKEEYGIS